MNNVIELAQATPRPAFRRPLYAVARDVSSGHAAGPHLNQPQ